MARKRKSINVSADIQIGDLIQYCPSDLESKYYDFGIILEINENISHEVWRFCDESVRARLCNREFTVLWQSSNCVDRFSSFYMNHSLINKKIILLKK